MKISSITIAKNEESNIERCIRSLLGCIDEIIILIDEGSTDKTLEIVSSFPQVKYDIVKWTGYSKTKKHAVSLTANDWVLWIDADEALTNELCEEINKFKNEIPECSAYSFPRKAYFLGKWIKHSGWYPGYVTRLFDKNKIDFSESDVHEYLIVDKEKIGKINFDLEHYTDPTISHYFNKFNVYTTLAAQELQKKGKKFLLSDITIRPAAIFFKMYFLKFGFLDGIQGFILALFSSAYVFTKYCKLWELKIKKKYK